MQNDREMRPIYSLEDLSSRIEVRNLDYAPTNMSTRFSEASDAAGREILQIYADSGQGKDIDVAHRMAIDVTISSIFGIDFGKHVKNERRGQKSCA